MRGNGKMRRKQTGPDAGVDLPTDALHPARRLADPRLTRIGPDLFARIPTPGRAHAASSAPKAGQGLKPRVGIYLLGSARGGAVPRRLRHAFTTNWIDLASAAP